MFQIYCDFNDRTSDDCYWLLLLNGQPLADQLGAVGLGSGDHVLLYQDADDFTVEGTVRLGVHPELPDGPKVLVCPDWSTKRTPSPSMGEG